MKSQHCQVKRPQPAEPTQTESQKKSAAERSDELFFGTSGGLLKNTPRPLTANARRQPKDVKVHPANEWMKPL